MSWPQFERQRIERGWSLREVAIQSGVAPGYLSELRSGVKVAPSAVVIRKLADVFHCEPWELTDEPFGTA